MARIVALSWALFGDRMDELSDAAGARRMNINLLYGRKYLAPFRYVGMFFMTMIMLARADPDTVYAQNPPIFCPLAAMLYCKVFGRRLVIDHHCVWSIKTVHSRAVDVMERFAARIADANTAPHQGWGEILLRRGANRLLVVHDFIDGTGESKVPPHEGFRVIASHGGHPREEIEAEAEAVGRAGGRLMVTGPPEKLASRMAKIKGAEYLGYLPKAEYEKLKRSCDMAINITTEPYTVSHVLYEYVACGLPALSRREQWIEGIFGDAILYVGEDLGSRVERMMGDPTTLLAAKERVRAKQIAFKEAHVKEIGRLKHLLG
jgi:Glycosyl transferase 4-like domain